MNDLLKKLNTLARSKIGDIAPTLPRFERTPNLDRQANDLRQRINDALDHEDSLQAAAQALRDEVARLDAAADTAIAQGRDAEARSLLDQLKRAEQRLTIAESDLRAHQRSAEELIQRVNMLEAAIADNRAATTTANPDTSPQRVEIPTDESFAAPSAAHQANQAVDAAHQQTEKTENAVQKISGLIKEAQDRTRERITMMGELLGAKETLTASTTPAPQPDEDESRLENIRPRPSLIQVPIEQAPIEKVTIEQVPIEQVPIEPVPIEPVPIEPVPSSTPLSAGAPTAEQKPAPVTPTTAPTTSSTTPEAAVTEPEDDAFARRLKRLSKPE